MDMLTIVSSSLFTQPSRVLIVNSMSGAMLILLAASHVPALKEFIGSRATLVGSHLERLFRNWRDVSFGGDSPSVDRSMWLIQQADSYIRGCY
jgi:hypothetical protein